MSRRLTRMAAQADDGTCARDANYDAHDKNSDRQSEHHRVDDRDHRRRRARRRGAGHRNIAVTSSMGPVSIEGFYDEAFAVPGLIQALLNAPDADAGIIACFDDTGLDAARSVGALSGGRDLRGGAGDRGADCKTHRGRHHAAALDRAAGRAGAPLWLCGAGTGHARAMSRCSISKSRAPVRKRNSTPRLRARSTRAPRRSCWAAPGWPISPQNCRKNSAFPWSTASPPR